MGEQFLATENKNPYGGWAVLKESVTEVPSAIGELAKEAWDHPWESGKHVLKTLGTSAGAGLLLGALIPARGPVAAIVGIGCTLPLVTGTLAKFKGYWQAGQRPGADAELLGHAMAKDFISTGAEIGLSTVGGFAGASAGMRLATSETMVGGALQKAQRTVLRAENGSLVGLAKAPELLSGKAAQTAMTAAGNEAAMAAEIAATAQSPLTQQPWFAGRNSQLRQRIAQFDAPPQEYTLRMGSLHGHSRYSDGMGTPKEIFTKAKQEGLDFYAITDHNHLAARGGIKDGDPRSVDQSGTPTVAEKPIYYSQTFADGAAVSQEGKFVALVGLEMGTIGKVGGGHSHSGGQRIALDRPVIERQPIQLREVTTGPAAEVPAPSAIAGEAKAAAAGKSLEPWPAGIHRETAVGPRHNHADDGIVPTTLADGTPVPTGANLTPAEQAIADLAVREAGHHSGVNHINLFEVPTFFESVKQPSTRTFAESLWAPVRRLIGRPEPAVVKEPPVVKYNDGDYAALIQHLDQIKDSTGGRAVIQLNHPRYLADHNPDLPAKFRGRDYGVKSFESEALWREKFGKYANQIEVITGQAMNPNPVEHLGGKDHAGVNLTGYVDKGLHLSPTYGRDDHFAMPGGRPAGTGIIADKLDKATLLEAMRQRRTMATTDRNLLHGYTTANDRFVMGSILDQNAVQGITTTAHIGGDLAAGAQYKLTLWGDKRIGDRKLATALETKEMTGAELSSLGGKVKFDQIESIIGKKSAYWVEVQRTSPDGTFTDHMWTAPIWIEPLAGNHSLLTKALVGLGSQSLGL